MNWFNLSIVGWIILIAALAIAAYMKHMPVIWIAIAMVRLPIQAVPFWLIS